MGDNRLAVMMKYSGYWDCIPRHAWESAGSVRVRTTNAQFASLVGPGVVCHFTITATLRPLHIGCCTIIGAGLLRDWHAAFVGIFLESYWRIITHYYSSFTSIVVFLFDNNLKMFKKTACPAINPYAWALLFYPLHKAPFHTLIILLISCFSCYI